MEKYMSLIIPAIAAGIILRLMLIPMKLVFRLLIHSICGLLCLWILNWVSIYTGIIFPINIITVLTAGLLGAPGIFLLASMAILT